MEILGACRGVPAPQREPYREAERLTVPAASRAWRRALRSAAAPPRAGAGVGSDRGRHSVGSCAVACQAIASGRLASTRHRSRGVIAPGSRPYVLAPPTMKAALPGANPPILALSAPRPSCCGLPLNASASVVSDRLRLRGRILGAAFPHCLTMTRPQRSFAHLPDEQFDALLRL
jgi:hypothetical protein